MHFITLLSLAILSQSTLKVDAPSAVEDRESIIVTIDAKEVEGKQVRWTVSPAKYRILTGRDDQQGVAYAFVVNARQNRDEKGNALPTCIAIALAVGDGESLRTSVSLVWVGHDWGSILPPPLPPPGPGPGPGPIPPVPVTPSAKSLNLAIWYDPDNITQEQGQVIAAYALREWLKSRNRDHKLTTLDMREDVDEQTGVADLIKGVGGAAVCVVQSRDQDSAGKLLKAFALPATLAALQAELEKLEAK